MRCFVAILLVAFVFVGNAVCSEPVDVPLGNVEDTKQDQHLPSREELLSMLDSMSDLSDEVKENLRQDLLQDIDDGDDDELPAIKRGLGTEQSLLLFALLGLLTLIFVFFGYKLYKSLTEKERLRNEKKRLKESKKKSK